MATELTFESTPENARPYKSEVRVAVAGRDRPKFPVLLVWLGLVSVLGVLTSRQVGWLRMADMRPCLLVQPTSVFDLNVRPGNQISIPVTLQNVTGDSVVVEGCQNSCGCMATSALPLTLRGGEHAVVTFAITVNGDSAAALIERSSRFIVDHVGPTPVVKFRLHVQSPAR